MFPLPVRPPAGIFEDMSGRQPELYHLVRPLDGIWATCPAASRAVSTVVSRNHDFLSGRLSELDGHVRAPAGIISSSPAARRNLSNTSGR